MKKRKVLFSVGILIFTCIVLIFVLLVQYMWPSKTTFSQNSKSKHLIVISIDALNSKDYDTIKDLPNIGGLLKEGSFAREVVGVYPSLTYPSHTSIITGTYPDKHGIYRNELNDVGIKEQRWQWYRKDIKVPTLYDLARQNNMKVGAIFWPVTSGAKIAYNLPEIWPVKKNESQTLLTLRNGSPLFLIDINARFGKIRNGKNQPGLDNFSAASAAYLIKNKKPELMLIHFTELDHERHKHGLMSNEARESLKNMDERVGQIIKSAKDGGIYASTTFIILGDHGFLDCDYKICLNAEFARQGLIDVDSNGKVKDWKAYVNYCDGSAQVYLKDQKDTAALNKAKEILEMLKKDPKNGIEAIYTKDEAEKKHVKGDFVLMLEAEKGYYFSNEWTGNTIVKIDKSKIDENDEYSYLATHGYDPLKPDYRTFFMASGSGINKGVVLPSINLVDEGPTMAELLGLKLPDADGKILSDIIKK